MVRFTFRKGLRLLEGTRVWTLIRRLATGKLQFESDDEEAPRVQLSEDEFYAKWRDRRWSVDEESLGPAASSMYLATPADMRSLGEKSKEEVARKLHYIQGLKKHFDEQGAQIPSSPEKLRPVLDQLAKERKDERAPSPATVWRWWCRFRATQSGTRLTDRRGLAVRKVDAVQMKIFEEAIEEIFLSVQKMPGKEVLDAVREKTKRLNKSLQPDQQVKTPAAATVYRWLNKLYYSVVQNARQGKATTARELRAVVGSVQVKRILERVEIDHTPIDVLVVCKLTRMVLGRPWLTLAIDRRSRMIVGFYISFHAPSAFSNLYCLRMAIMPKDQLLEEIGGTTLPWPARGIPSSLVCDNGMDLHADALETVCLSAAIELIYMGVAHPELKGAIERMFRTLNVGLFHQLPGTVFSNIDERGEYAAEKLAALDLETLTQVLVKWIVDVYHNTPHRGLAGRTPLEVWTEEAQQRVVELPAYPHELDTMVGHATTRTVFHYGVEFDSLHYNSAVLQLARQRRGGNPQVQIRAYEHDVGYIDVLDADNNEFIRVPALDKEYADGLNRHAHRLVRAQVRRRFGEEWRQDQLRQAKAEIQAIVAAATKAQKAGTRKRVAAVQLVDSEAALGIRAKNALSEASDPVDPDAADELSLESEVPPADLPRFGVSTAERQTA